MALLRSIGTTLEMIKWEHSVLTLPFGLTGAVLAARGIPSLHTSIWIIVALVAARSAAMAFNRLADATIDAANPRTRVRALPAGKLKQVIRGLVRGGRVRDPDLRGLSTESAGVLPVAGGAGIVFLYSFTKRFTRWSHVVLGSPWARAGRGLDCGARLARSTHSDTDRGGGLLGCRFDILYSCQDYESTARPTSIPFRRPSAFALRWASPGSST